LLIRHSLFRRFCPLGTVDLYLDIHDRFWFDSDLNWSVVSTKEKEANGYLIENNSVLIQKF